MFSPWPATSQPSSPSEGETKARWCRNFLKGTDWPAGAFRTTNSPFVLGILGSDPFGGVHDSITNQPVRNRPVVLKKCQMIEEAKECHLLVVSELGERKLQEILYELRDSSVLTVGETKNFTRMGGVATMTFDKKKKPPLEFETSDAALKQAKLFMHSELRDIGNKVP